MKQHLRGQSPLMKPVPSIHETGEMRVHDIGRVIARDPVNKKPLCTVASMIDGERKLDLERLKLVVLQQELKAFLFSMISYATLTSIHL